MADGDGKRVVVMGRRKSRMGKGSVGGKEEEEGCDGRGNGDVHHAPAQQILHKFAI